MVRRWTIEGEVVEGRTYADVWRLLAFRLRVAGPRKLVAVRDDGAEVCCSLYEGESYARDARSRDVMHVIDRAYQFRGAA